MEQESIKLNLDKQFFDQEKKKEELREEIDNLRRKITKAFTYNQQDEVKQYKEQKVKKEDQVQLVEKEIKSQIKKLLNDLKESKTKWIILCYHDRISSFSLDTFIQVSQRLDLQVKNTPKSLVIARPLSHGKKIDELIQISKKETESASNKTNKKCNDQQELGSGSGPEPENSQAINSKPEDNKKIVSKENPEIVQPLNTQEEATKEQKEKVNQTKKSQQNNQNQSNKQASGANKNDKNSKKPNNSQLQNKEEENITDIIKNPFENQEKKKDKNAMLQEIEEEQKEMTKKEIIESLDIPADSVKGYKIVSMTDEYLLTISVFQPEQNSFPIEKYNVYLIKEKEIAQQISSDIFFLLPYDKQYLCSSQSKAKTIEINLQNIPQSYILGLSEETSYFQIAITAVTQNPQSYELESKITHTFRLNMPKIILKKTRLLVAGSCELINQNFFQNQDEFISNYSQKHQAMKNFITLNSQLFNQVQIQSINMGQSAMILLKNGQVIQWGNVLYFNEGVTECDLSKLQEETGKFRTEDPFMPVEHPLVFTKIAQGKSHYVGVTIDGKVYSWGKNKYGQLGHQNYISYEQPKRIEYLFTNKIFIVNVQCGDNFTVCQSQDGYLYTFGKNQCLEGLPIKDRYENTINFCNKGINQLVPRKIPFDQKIISYSCGKGHCLFITDKKLCYGWGDNKYQQISSSEFYGLIENFAAPIPINQNTNKQLFFKKVFCSDKSNCAIMQNQETQEQFIIQWGNNTQMNKIVLTQPDSNTNSNNSSRSQPITNFDNFYTNTYSSMLVQNQNGNIKLFSSGKNMFYSLGVNTKEIKNLQMVAISPCSEIIEVSFGSKHTTALLVA